MDEVEHDVTKARRRTVEAGPFRVRPDGTQERRKIPLHRSEAFLTDLLEEVCERMSAYKLESGAGTQARTFKRFAPRKGEDIYQDFHKFYVFSDAYLPLRAACDTVLEEFEEEILALVAQGARGMADTLCGEKAGLCEGPAHPAES
ncbi:protein canopy homolog 1 [Erinaceus europaeus]|uniref:Protein canopy homolog 1 n=1 Tax=Erinaceus europaeus TaxID=9365 RepID=A0ABM3XVL5_ERIEU|nr:protein canopy homolog 1 [Erinaceus europaeus]